MLATFQVSRFSTMLQPSDGQFFLGVGAFVAGWIAYGCAKGSPGTALQWRLPVRLPRASSRLRS
jgi:hypothetical protein